MLKDEYLAVHGHDRVAAAVNFALDLMRAAADRSHLGYTRQNAVWAVSEMFELSGREQVNVNQLLDDAEEGIG